MPVFIQIETEKLVQINDKTRININKSFATDDVLDIERYEIQPDLSAPFIAAPNLYLDWLYTDAGLKTITVRCIRTSETVTKQKILEVISAEDDGIYTTDADILPLEPDLLNYCRAGRSSFLDVHREAKSQILTWLKEKGFVEVETLNDRREVLEASKFLCLQLIFESLSNAIDDIFSKKAEKYKKNYETSLHFLSLSLDLNDDGIGDKPSFIGNFEITRA